MYGFSQKLDMLLEPFRLILKVSAQLPDVRSQTLIAVSFQSESDTSRWPSAEKAAETMVSRWPSNI